MFHFDPTDYLCPTHIKCNSTRTFEFHNTSIKNDSKNHSVKITATSA